MATSAATRLRVAIAAVVNADAGVQSLCGRTTGCLVHWRVIGKAKMPAIAYVLPSDRELDGIDDPRECFATFTAMADGETAPTIAEALLQRVRECLSPVALFAQGVDATILEITEREVEDDTEIPAGRARRDLDLLLRVEA